jgi:starvation-inducible DNA-binding protein
MDATVRAAKSSISSLISVKASQSFRRHGGALSIAECQGLANIQVSASFPEMGSLCPDPIGPRAARSRSNPMSDETVKARRTAPLQTPNDLGTNAIKDISGALNALLADTFALYVKTKNYHWHMSGPHFRDYHLLLDEHGDQIFAMTDPIAERVRKLGGMTIHSIGNIARLQRIKDNDADYVTPDDMLAELREDNKQLTASLRETHDLCDEHNDVATASLIEVWIDETERRVWFLYEAGRRG